MSGDASEMEDAENEEIIGEMDQVREKLEGGIDRLGEEMRNVFDWQAYVRSAPLTSVGIALAAGYLIAPAIRSRPNPTLHPTFNVPAAPVPTVGIVGSLTNMAFSTLSRIASAYLSEMFVSQVAPPPPADPEPHQEFHSDPGPVL